MQVCSYQQISNGEDSGGENWQNWSSSCISNYPSVNVDGNSQNGPTKHIL